MDARLEFAGELTTDDKISPKLRAGEYEEWALGEAPNTVRVLVQFFSDATVDEARSGLESLGLEGQRHGPQSRSLVVAINRIGEIAELDAVQWIEQGPIPFLALNETGRRRSDSNEPQAADLSSPRPVYQVGGRGVRIGISDTGVDDNHDDFASVTAAGGAGALRVYKRKADPRGHGTHVASIAAGNGLNSVANGLPAFHRRGHAPTAQIGAYPGFWSTIESYHNATVNDETDVMNHSYVQSWYGYDSVAAGIDSIVRGDEMYMGDAIPGRPHVWAAGNNGLVAQHGHEEGYYATFTSAKNTISVGSIDTRDGRLSDFSSLGPTFDGRINSPWRFISAFLRIRMAPALEFRTRNAWRGQETGGAPGVAEHGGPSDERWASLLRGLNRILRIPDDAFVEELAAFRGPAGTGRVIASARFPDAVHRLFRGSVVERGIAWRRIR